MYNYDFDKIVDRKNTGSLKHDCAFERGMPDGLIPLWVADMDFPTANEIVGALEKTVKHGIFGYSEPYREYFGILKAWISEYFGADVKKTWLIQTPGIVFAIATAVRAFTREGESVIIQPPVYYPFSEITQVNNRRLIVNDLVNTDGVYTIDFEDFEKKIVENDVKLFILCNPHNPVGRVWTKDELTGLGRICLKHNVVAVSDEIHANFIYGGRKHLSFLSFPELFPICAVCTSPGKTFNMAGLQLSDIFIPDPVLRGRFVSEHQKSGYSQLNVFSHAGALAAYKYGGEWLKQILVYLEQNRDFMKKYIDENIPEIKMTPPEGTYLAWLDFNDIGVSYTERRAIVVGEARLWLDRGELFGDVGAGFERLNFACPRSVLEKALTLLKAAVKNKNLYK